MLAIRSAGPVDLHFYFSAAPHAMEEQALFGKRAPHMDGWGFAFYPQGSRKLHVVKGGGREEGETVNNYFARIESVIPIINSDMVIAHVRKASNPPRDQRNAQPFEFGNFSFAHNGSIKQHERVLLRLREEIKVRDPPLPVLNGYNDSEVFFRLIMQVYEDTGSIVQAIKDAVEFIKEVSDYSSLNFMLTDGSTLYAYSDVKASVDGQDDYYHLHYTRRNAGVSSSFSHQSDATCMKIEARNLTNDAVLVASEKLTPDQCEPWQTLEIGALLAVDARLNVQKKLLVDF